MIKTLARGILPASLRLAIWEARQRPWKQAVSQWYYDRLPDSTIHHRQFTKAFGRRGNFTHPTTFNEKLHWISLHYRKPIQTQLADKYAVRQYVADRGLADTLNELYGVWDSSSNIPFDHLPDSYILKVTHGSGKNLIRRHKARINVESTRRQLAQWMKRSEYWASREWAYKNINPRIICERLLTDEHENVPADFKFFCFNGEPQMIQVDTDRFTEHHRDLFDLTWKPMPFSFEYPSSGQAIPKPVTLMRMISAAQILSHGFPFVRVDFYSMEARVIFGEMTWYPEGGLGRFTPEEYDTLYGEMISLPRN